MVASRRWLEGIGVNAGGCSDLYRLAPVSVFQVVISVACRERFVQIGLVLLLGECDSPGLSIFRRRELSSSTATLT
ncbi:hypothetical protein RS9916_28184 [Synechococcus sp. RS9916]|nr:hypothetical protein RS9916_28184 [Synechococcus sp. RS9916]